MKIQHWNTELFKSLDEILKLFPKGGRVLDLGAGDGLTKNLFPSNWEWCGIDICPLSDEVSKGDAHSLKFSDESFDVVISIAVFEHLHSPWVAIKEVNRVLVQGGFFLGTVAFLEPEHSNSYFHMTRRGMSRIIEEGGLVVKHVEPTEGWNVGTSMRIIPLPGMNYFNRFRSYVAFSLRSFLINLRILTLKGEARQRAQKYKKLDKYRYSGSFYFLANK